MRICFIVASLDILGGHSVEAVEMANALKGEGLTVGILPINPRASGFWRAFQKVRLIRTIVTEMIYLKSLFRDVPKYDVLHIFSASYWSFLLAPAPAILIGRFFKKRIILNYHSGEAEDHLKRNGFIVKGVLKFVDVLVVPSVYLQRIFAGHGIEAKVAHNFIDAREFPFKVRSDFKANFIVTRNLESMYNLPCILRAFKLIREKFADARLTITGSGRQERYLMALSSDLNLKNVIFTGRVGHDLMAAHYNESDIMLNASDIDNQPISILEAFYSGLPVVSTASGGIPDMIEDGHNGMLVPLNDEKALAEKAIYLLENRSIARKIAQNAFEGAKKHYSWEAVRQRWLDSYGPLKS